jgi:hypothetical protein
MLSDMSFEGRRLLVVFADAAVARDVLFADQSFVNRGSAVAVSLGLSRGG